MVSGVSTVRFGFHSYIHVRTIHPVLLICGSECLLGPLGCTVDCSFPDFAGSPFVHSVLPVFSGMQGLLVVDDLVVDRLVLPLAE